MIKELDQVALVAPIPEHDLEPGDVGTVVDIFADGKAYAVEFFSITGETIVVTTVEADHVRPVAPMERLHTRPPKAQTT